MSFNDRINSSQVHHGTFSRIYISLNNYKKDWNHIKYVFWPSWNNRENNRILVKLTNMWKLNNIFLSNKSKKKSQGKWKKHFQENENESLTYQPLWDAAKGVLTEEFIAIITHIGKEGNHISKLYPKCTP